MLLSRILVVAACGAVVLSACSSGGGRRVVTSAAATTSTAAAATTTTTKPVSTTTKVAPTTSTTRKPTATTTIAKNAAAPAPVATPAPTAPHAPPTTAARAVTIRSASLSSCSDSGGTVTWHANVSLSNGASGTVAHSQGEYTTASGSASIGGHTVSVTVYTYAPGYSPLCSITSSRVQ